MRRRCALFFLSVVFLALFLCVTSSPLSPRLPFGQAERMIKALNLLPGVAEEEESSSPSSLEGPQLLQERRIHLDIRGGDSDVTAEDLGHYAGYFKLARTHAAKYCSPLILKPSLLWLS
jgi:serine carboxypeptidase-like clade 4